MGGKQCFRRGSIQTMADRCSNVEYICKYFEKPGHVKLILRTKKSGGGGGGNSTFTKLGCPCIVYMKSSDGGEHCSSLITVKFY